MIVAIPYSEKDQDLARQLAEWLRELGPFPNHYLLVARDAAADPEVFGGHNQLHGFGACTQITATKDSWNKWPESANHLFRTVGKYIERDLRAPFLWLEPDSVPLRATAFDEIAAEYQTAIAQRKRFLGDMQGRNRHPAAGANFIPHMSGLAVYPGLMSHHAGTAYQAFETAFDIVGAPQIVPQMMQSELLLHVWKAPPFESWADVERRILAVRPKCAIYHSDKSGSLLKLLRERKRGDEKCAAPAITEEVNTTEEFAPSIKEVASSAAVTSEPETAAASPAETIFTTPDGPMPLGGTGIHGIKCTCLEHDFPCPFHFRDYENVPLPEEMSVPVAALPLIIKTAEVWAPKIEDFILGSRTPWESKKQSLSEINALCDRLRQFQTCSTYVRFVREKLHEAGVIELPYRFRKRKGWKKKNRVGNWKRKAIDA